MFDCTSVIQKDVQVDVAGPLFNSLLSPQAIFDVLEFVKKLYRIQRSFDLRPSALASTPSIKPW